MSFSNLFRTKTVAQIQRDAELGYSDHGDLEPQHPHLRRTLGTLDLTSLGIAAIIGAGIFAMIGKAAHDGGPAVIFLFIFTGFACGFSALCYAEFASKIPIAGSAYTYAYASFGELVAWIIGWDLIMEYAIGNIAVAVSWSDYFTTMLSGLKLPALGYPDGIHLPAYLTMDFRTAYNTHGEIAAMLANGQTLESVKAMPEVSKSAIEAYTAWTTAPRLGSLPVVLDIPALVITLIITTLVYVGIRESKRASNVMVALKLAVIFLVIGLGAYYVRPENWTAVDPATGRGGFAPNGFGGVMSGVAAVFFAYIGFDALSTTAEECKNPRRDLPRAMIYSLIICTVIYIALALVLTGMVSYTKLNVGDPLAFVFGPEGVNIPWVAGVVSVSAVIAIATVLLVFQLGQPRIWMAMSRDGLLPPIFSSIHPRFKTPWFSTIVTGLVVAIPSLFMNLTEVTELSSIGTLFAFVLVCGGVLLGATTKGLETGGEAAKATYVPYVSSRYIAPAIFLVVWAAIIYHDATNAPGEPDVLRSLFSLQPSADAPGEGPLRVFFHKFPYYVYILFSVVMTVLCFVKRLSLIPVLGLMSCAYLMSELGISNWARFGSWLLAGLVVYFLYSYRHSRLGKKAVSSER